MNSTNDTEQKIKAIFDGVVMANCHENYLHTVINKNIDTYYEEPQHPAQACYSFIDTASVESLTEYLNDFWMELGNEEFTAMVGEMSELAFSLGAGDEASQDDVSPLIYAMY